MTKKFYVDQIGTIKNRNIFYDTNIWLFLEGFNGQSRAKRQLQYEAAHKNLLKNGNVIITNEYVLAEFCNRIFKSAYDFAKAASGLGNSYMLPKEFRSTQRGQDALFVAREASTNIISDHEFCSCHDKHYNIKSVIDDYSTGLMDFSDVLITKHCASEKYMLMTDDGDFSSSDLELISANRRIFN